MIEELLRILAEGGVHSYEELAERLSVPMPLLEMMLEDLARLGYLRSTNNDCGTHCASCPIGGCSIAGRGRLWTLTQKGSQAAARLV